MIKQTTILILLLMAQWNLLDAQPITVKYPAGNIAYTKIDGVVTFYNAQGKVVRIIDLNKKTDLDLRLGEEGKLFSSYKNVAEHGGGCKVEITYNKIGLKIKEARYDCNFELKNEIWTYGYDKYGNQIIDERNKYDTYGNIIEQWGSANYFTFNNVTLLFDNLGDVTQNLYDKKHYLIKQLHYQNNKQRATSYIEYDNQCRLKERFTYDRVLKCITNYQSFYYNIDTAIIPSLVVRYEPHTQEGVLWIAEKEWTDTTETRTSYRLSIAAEPLAKMAIQDFRALINKEGKAFESKKPQYFSKDQFKFKKKYLYSEYTSEYFYSPDSWTKTVYEYDSNERRTRTIDTNKKGEVITNYIYKYDELFFP